MDNWDGPMPWKHKQAKWSVPDLEKSISIFCKFCNDAKIWDESNDCVSPECVIFPYRPGIQNPEVKGVKRAIRKRVSLEQREASKNNAAKHFTPRGVHDEKGEKSARKAKVRISGRVPIM